MNLGDQKKLALIVCSKKPYRTLEDYALTLAGIPPLTTTAFKIRSENDELNRLYHSYLKTLEYAAALGDLRAAKAGLNWVCRYQDFEEWAQKTGYMEAPAVENIARPKKSFEKRLEAPAKRKMLKPKQRDTLLSLLLIYEITERYDIEYLDELQGPKAWAKIIEKEFMSNLITSISDTKRSITLSDGERLDKKEFLEKYRKRFEYT